MDATAARTTKAAVEPALRAPAWLVDVGVAGPVVVVVVTVAKEVVATVEAAVVEVGVGKAVVVLTPGTVLKMVNMAEYDWLPPSTTRIE